MTVQTATPIDSRKAAVPRTADEAAIRPFRVNVPEAQLVELRRRILATRWPERETVEDRDYVFTRYAP